MPPSRPRAQPDDSRSEGSSTKEKVGTPNTVNGKGRRIGGTAAPGSSLRDVVTAVQNTTAVGASGSSSSDPNPGVSSHLQLLTANLLML